MTLNFASQAKFSHPKLTRRAEKRKVDTKGEAAASSMPISGVLVLSKLIGARNTYSGIWAGMGEADYNCLYAPWNGI